MADSVILTPAAAAAGTIALGMTAEWVVKQLWAIYTERYFFEVNWTILAILCLFACWGIGWSLVDGPKKRG